MEIARQHKVFAQLVLSTSELMSHSFIPVIYSFSFKAHACCMGSMAASEREREKGVIISSSLTLMLSFFLSFVVAATVDV